MLVSMSRFRVPTELLLLVLCAGFLTRRRSPIDLTSRGRRSPRDHARRILVDRLAETRAAAAMALGDAMKAWRLHVILSPSPRPSSATAATTSARKRPCVWPSIETPGPGADPLGARAARATARSARLGEDLARTFLEADDELLPGRCDGRPLPPRAGARGDRDERTPPAKSLRLRANGSRGMTPPGSGP